MESANNTVRWDAPAKWEKSELCVEWEDHIDYGGPIEQLSTNEDDGLLPYKLDETDCDVDQRSGIEHSTLFSDPYHDKLNTAWLSANPPYKRGVKSDRYVFTNGQFVGPGGIPCALKPNTLAVFHFNQDGRSAKLYHPTSKTRSDMQVLRTGSLHSSTALGFLDNYSCKFIRDYGRAPTIVQMIENLAQVNTVINSGGTCLDGLVKIQTPNTEVVTKRKPNVMVAQPLWLAVRSVLLHE